MSREDAQLKLRLPEELKQKVTDAARANNRSVNAELVARIEQTFDLKLEERMVELATRAGVAEGRASANFEVFTLTAEILAAASGNDRETMQLLADAIRSLNTGSKEDQDAARKATIERLAQSLHRPLENE